MPQLVICATEGERNRRNREVMRERVTLSDLESELFISHLVERIEWALADADSIEAHQRLSRGALPRSASKRPPQAVGA